MVKIAIVSDIHLKLRRHKVFELNRFRMLVEELCNSPADIIIINGDLLNHANPTLEELREVTDMLIRLRGRKIYLLDGNHEAVTKDSSTYDYFVFLTALGVIHIKDITQILEQGVLIDLCPWSRINELKDCDGADILVSHYRSAMSGLYKAELDTSKFLDKYDLVVLGDIHDRYKPEDNVIYTGPPYNIAFSKSAHNDYGYLMLTITKNEYDYEYVNLDLPRKVKIELQAEDLDEFEPDPQHLYRVHLTGTLDQLKGVSNYGNVMFKKYIKLRTLDPDVQTPVKDEPFLDRLSHLVEESLSVKSRAGTTVRGVITKLQGDL